MLLQRCAWERWVRLWTPSHRKVQKMWGSDFSPDHSRETLFAPRVEQGDEKSADQARKDLKRTDDTMASHAKWKTQAPKRNLGNMSWLPYKPTPIALGARSIPPIFPDGEQSGDCLPEIDDKQKAYCLNSMGKPVFMIYSIKH